MVDVKLADLSSPPLNPGDSTWPAEVAASPQFCIKRMRPTAWLVARGLQKVERQLRMCGDQWPNDGETAMELQT